MNMELRSQEVRTLAPENDPLKMGMGWKVEDLSKPQIMVESTFGDSHPGSAHLDQFVKEAVQAVNDNGGKAARYFATDMCDGIAQGHDGINYSLPHRDAIVNLVEAQANASVYDGGVFIASCDKSVPAMLMSIGRLKDMSAIVVTGGVMEAHTLPKEYVVNDPACAINELLTLEQIGKFDAWEKTGVIPNSQLDYYKHNACPSCGACSFMGTASTMQIMAEALGLMLPGTALMPATAPELKQAAMLALGTERQVKFICADEVASLPAAEGQPQKASSRSKTPQVQDSPAAPAKKQRSQGTRACLNDLYTFDSFVVYEDSRFAYQAGLSIAQSERALFNPLFLYGKSGVGKTHLLQAIGHEVLHQDSSANVVYVTGEQFANESR